MKALLTVFALSLTAMAAEAYSDKQPNVLQMHYSPIGRAWGDSDEEFFQDETTYEHFNLTFDKAFAGRFILNNKYISYSQHYGHPYESPTNPENVSFTSLSAGVALNLTFLEPEYDKYFISNFGLGTGTFYFNDTDAYDHEFFAEAGAEFGVKPLPHLLTGVGFNFKLFGYPGQTTAQYLDIYLSVSVIF